MSTIHPALLPRNLSKLPVSLQRVARNAMSEGTWMGTSTTTIQQLSAMRPDAFLGLLPVIYALLDPSLLPSPETDTVTVVLGAMHSALMTWAYLDGAVHSRMFPAAATLDLWPRLWAWIDFFSLHSDDLVGPSEVATFFGPVSRIIREFGNHPPTLLSMVATTGIRRVLAEIWTRRVRIFDGDGNITKQLGDIESALHALEAVKDLRHLLEVFDGCGGQEAFCLTLTCTIELATKHPTLASAVGTVGGVCLLLNQMQDVAPNTVPYLLSHGFIPPFVSALGVVGPSSSPVPFPIALGSLTTLLYVDLGYPWVQQALQSGLLNQIVSWGCKGGIMQAAHPEITKQLPDLLRDVLPRALVYYPVIVEMKQALANVEPPSSDGEFARSGLYACWSDMKAIFELRAATITLWETEGRPSPLSCYNLECAKVLNRDKFRRCSACQTAAYCSQACQRVDWTDGHREDCRLHQEAPRAFPRAGLCHRDKLFIRMIVHMDYRRLRVLVTMEMVRFMAENPDTPLVVNFDYTRGTPDISVFPISTSNGSEILSPYLRRLARAGGRLVAHTIRFGCGIPTFNVVWPLCAPTLEFNDGLKQIAREAKGLEEAELKSRVVKLTERTNRKDTEEGYYG